MYGYVISFFLFLYLFWIYKCTLDNNICPEPYTCGRDTTFLATRSGSGICDLAAMAGMLGRIEEFDGSKDDWLQYVERFEHFFVANGITTPEKK